MLGAIVTIVFIASAERLAAAFVPAQVKDASIKYVQIYSIPASSSAIQLAVSNRTRALDNPDVPLLIASISVAVNIVLDLLIISKFCVGLWSPTIINQTLSRITYDMISALVGLVYFAYIARRLRRQNSETSGSMMGHWKGFSIAILKILVPPWAYKFIESALRNALYL